MSEPNESTISPWIPITNPHMVACIAKAIEEMNELSGRLARCLMAGFDDIDPDSKRTNIQELNREYSDAKAVMVFLGKYEPRLMHMPERVEGKIRGFEHWHELINDHYTKHPFDQAATAFVEGN